MGIVPYFFMSVDANPRSSLPKNLGVDINCSFMIGIPSSHMSVDVDPISIWSEHSKVKTYSSMIPSSSIVDEKSIYNSLFQNYGGGTASAILGSIESFIPSLENLDVATTPSFNSLVFLGFSFPTCFLGSPYGRCIINIFSSSTNSFISSCRTCIVTSIFDIFVSSSGVLFL